MSVFDFFKRAKKKGRSSAPRREPKLMSIDGENETPIRIAISPKREGGQSKQGTRKKGKKKVQVRKWYWRLLRKLFVPGVVFTSLFSLWIWYDLPNIGMIGDIKKTPGVTIKAEDGTILGSYGDVYGDFVPYSQLPKHLIDAVVATEDRNFFHHYGIDPFGLARAMWVNMRAKRFVQGGSTITQQLAKNAFLTQEKTLKRKVQEAILALEIEHRFKKQDILAMYLNRVYMGAGNFGVDAASQRYFGHHVQEINLNEAALLVGLLKAPTRYAPSSNPERSEKRGTQVLLNMMDAGYLTQKQVDDARKDFDEDAVYRDSHTFGVYYFNDYVMSQIFELIGEVKQDITVTTTLQLDKQHKAEDAVDGIMSKKAGPVKAGQAALLSMSPDGAIRAMVGGRSYRASQFNRATQALRQPGSAFKLFVFLAGLEAGYTPESEMEDKPVVIGKWRPQNMHGYQGMVNLRNAVAESINSIAIQLSEVVGRSRVIEMAQRLGITETIDANPSLALGTTEVSLLEMTRAYAHLASGGNSVRPFAIRKIENTDGKTLYQHQSSTATKVLSSDTVAMMNNMLLAVTTSGTGRGALIGRPVAGKTGTASDYRDAWFVGFVPQLVTGVWVGNDDTSPMKKVTGGSLPASIFRSYMIEALKGTQVAGIPSLETSNSALPWLSEGLDGPGSPPPHAMQNPGMPAVAPSAPEQPLAANDPFAIVDREESGEQEEPTPHYEVPPSFWDRLTGNE